MTSRAAGAMTALALACGVAIFARLLIDVDPVNGRLSLAWPEQAWLMLRVHGALAGIGLGAALALAGVLLQAALRNPLAAPSLLGVGSGAGLGVMVVLYLAWLAGLQATTGMWTIGACVGAIATLLLVIHLGTRQGWPDPVSTILAGVIVATMASGAMVLLQSLVPEGLRGRFLAWAMGTVPELPSHGLLVALWCLLGVSAVGAGCWARRLDALLLGDDTATSLGAQPGLVRLTALLCAGLLTALCVALAGPLAFVGLVAPHAARRLLGSGHRLLLPGAMLCGAALVVGADALRQAIDVGSGRLPVGILTTLLGGPAFLFLLRREMGGRHAGM